MRQNADLLRIILCCAEISSIQESLWEEAEENDEEEEDEKVIGNFQREIKFVIFIVDFKIYHRQHPLQFVGLNKRAYTTTLY